MNFSKAGFSALGLVLIFGFQNCAKTSFAPDQGAISSKAGLDGILGTADDVVDGTSAAGPDGVAGTPDDLQPGPDGALGTDDDASPGPDGVPGNGDDIAPGPDGNFGTDDDIAPGPDGVLGNDDDLIAGPDEIIGTDDDIVASDAPEVQDPQDEENGVRCIGNGIKVPETAVVACADGKPKCVKLCVNNANKVSDFKSARGLINSGATAGACK